MKLFVGFLLLSFVSALVLRKRTFTLNIGFLALVCVAVCVGYFFFNQI